MENRDLKDIFKTVKERKKKEKMERLLVYLSGILLALVFVAIGLNLFSKSEKPISEPEIKIVKDINQPVAEPKIPAPEQIKQNTENQPSQMEEVKIPQQQENTKTTSDITSNKEEKVVQETQEKKEETVTQKQQAQPDEKKTPKKEKETASKNEKSKPEVKSVQESQAKPEQKSTDKAQQKQTKNSVVVEKAKKENESDNIISAIKSGFFSIQVGAFSTKEKAMIEKSKYPQAFIIEEGGLYKVLVGRFETDKEAREYKNSKGIDGFVKRVRD